MSESSSNALLTVTALSIEVAEKPLISNFDLSVGRGKVVEIRGSNGSGKTTLLRTLAGIRRSTQGAVDLGGNEFVYLGQKLGLCTSLTPLENLRWFARIANQEVTNNQLMEALSQVGLRSCLDTPVGSLSAGQARRCCLARLIAANVPLWLMDEPLTSLDDSGTTWLTDEIAAHTADGGAAVVATHSHLGLPNTVTINLDAS